MSNHHQVIDFGTPAHNRFAYGCAINGSTCTYFYLIFQKRDLITGKLVNTVPLLVYAFVYYTVVGVVLQMNWFENGMNQVALIGTFTMMPVILIGAVKMAWDYT